MAGDQNYMDDLGLDMLDEAQDSSFTDDLILGEEISSKGITENKAEEPKHTEKQNNSSEKLKTSESVAGEEGKTRTSEEGSSSKGGSDSSPGGNDMSQLYSSLATTLHDSGVLSSLNTDEPIKDANGLIKAIQNQINSGLDETTKAFKEAMERGVPEDRFIKYQRAIGNLNSITDAQLADDSEQAAQLRSRIIRQNYLADGYSQEDADRLTKRSLELGEDKADAKTFLPRMINRLQANFEEEQAKLEQEEKEVNNNIKSYIDKKKEIVDGLELDDAMKEKLFKQITTPVARDKEGQPVSVYSKALKENKEEMRVITEYLFMITDGFKDFSKLTTAVETKVSRKLDDVLKSSSSNFNQGGDGGQGFNIDDDPRSSFLKGDLDIDI